MPVLLHRLAGWAIDVSCGLGSDTCSGAPWNSPSIGMPKISSMSFTSTYWDKDENVELILGPTRNNSHRTTHCPIVCNISDATSRSGITSLMFWLHLHSDVWPFFGDLLRNVTGSPQSSVSPAGVFSVTTDGNEIVTLVGDTRYRSTSGPYFSNATRVHVDKFPCTIISVTDDALTLYLPPPEQVHPRANNSPPFTGYASLAVTNPWDAAVSCPPTCPGTTYPVHTNQAGIYYVVPCNSSRWLSGIQCLNISTAQRCALRLGTSGSCVDCPGGGFCPGGPRLWYALPACA